jgi:hypothetical protein
MGYYYNDNDISNSKSIAELNVKVQDNDKAIANITQELKGIKNQNYIDLVLIVILLIINGINNPALFNMLKFSIGLFVKAI